MKMFKCPYSIVPCSQPLLSTPLVMCVHYILAGFEFVFCHLQPERFRLIYTPNSKHQSLLYLPMEYRQFPDSWESRGFGESRMTLELSLMGENSRQL